jgi:hypothetical protein
LAGEGTAESYFSEILCGAKRSEHALAQSTTESQSPNLLEDPAALASAFFPITTQSFTNERL